MLAISALAPLLLTQAAAPASVRMVDANGDGLLDLLENGADGSLAVSLNRGDRRFERVPQELPQVAVSAVLSSTLSELSCRYSPECSTNPRPDSTGPPK